MKLFTARLGVPDPSVLDITDQYIALLRGPYAKSPMPFVSILEAQRRVLACYCTDGASHLHWMLVADVLLKIASYRGNNIGW